MEEKVVQAIGEQPGLPLATSGGSIFGRIQTFQALAYRDFRYLWLGQITNSASLWIEQVARPILVLDMTGSAVHLGLVLAARTLPQFGFCLIGGVFADWYDRRTL